MKKMLAKAVALSLVLGGVGFVANDALAADIGPAVNEANIATNKANIAKNAENISAN